MKKPLNPSQPPDKMQLDADAGWLGLGDYDSANDESEKITPQWRGYRRIHALLQRQGVDFNRKTVYQHLRRQTWLASHRHRTEPPGRSHKGKVAVRQPNSRWACDITTFKLWSAAKLRLALIIDCADRRVISWELQARLAALEIGELLRETLFKRFGHRRRI